MPTLFRMADGKESTDAPTVVIEETAPSVHPRKTKKYVIIAVSAILSAAIILTAILVGMHLFSEAQKEIIKYTLDYKNNAKQEVTSDPNTNIVQYHVSSHGLETWIVNDFNKDIQVVKIQTDSETTCYLNALNRTTAMDPSQIANPKKNGSADSSSLAYTVSNTPISDSSFISKPARDMCKGVSIYWVYPRCLDKDSASQNMTDMSPRSKRDIDGSPYYYLSYSGTSVCIAGCCKKYCSCRMRYYWVEYANGVISCFWFFYDCRWAASRPSYYGCYNGPRGLSCPAC